MPQMSPMKWLYLFMFFSMIFILFNMMNYFIYTLPPMMNIKSSNFKKKLYISMNWKW